MKYFTTPQAMFDGHYREKEASTIPIPNIRFAVFEAMMRCIYTGACPALPLEQALAHALLLSSDLLREICCLALDLLVALSKAEHAQAVLIHTTVHGAPRRAIKALHGGSAAACRLPSSALTEVSCHGKCEGNFGCM